MRNALRIFFVGGLTSYRALFNWVNPWVYVPHMLAYPVFEILFFAYLGRFANVQSDKFFLVGNAFISIAMTGFFGMGNAVGGERRSQTLATLLASPANRFALFLGRAVPSIVTGLVTAALAFTICSFVLHAHFAARELAGLALAGLTASFACTSFGLCLGSLGLRGRSVSLFADMIGGSMLLVSGANVPLDRLPAAIRAIGSVIPLTHGIAAGRILAAGGSVASARHLLLTEAFVGAVYFVVGIALLRVLEYSGRRSAALETF
ncbi:MAG TPA: ABC transporter permease [Gaiellaceae bacterium]|jgi:ABC-2 type transport system permease protein|nr:ABC transporter permease [Gaiellaceae bacterium]